MDRPQGDGSPVRLVAAGGWGTAASGTHGVELTADVGMELVGGGERSYRMGIRLGRGPAAWLNLEANSAYGESGTQEHALTLRVRGHRQAVGKFPAAPGNEVCPRSGPAAGTAPIGAGQARGMK